MRMPRGARGQMIGQVQKDRKGVGLSLLQWPRRVERRGALRFNAVVVNTVARSGHALTWCYQSVSGSVPERPPNRPAASQPR
jgi:hypothetical protein